jgi:hypothetical protein
VSNEDVVPPCAPPEADSLESVDAGQGEVTDAIRREPTSAGLWGRNYRVGYWIAWLAVLGFLITAAIACFGHSAASAAGTCGGGGESDYNGDCLRDTAIADPDATIGGKAGSGAVTVIYGGTARDSGLGTTAGADWARRESRFPPPPSRAPLPRGLSNAFVDADEKIRAAGGKKAS